MSAPSPQRRSAGTPARTAAGPPVRGSLWLRLAIWRDWVRRLPGGFVVWRLAVTAVGALVIVLGVVLLPLPGPGWLVIFLGVGLLSTEYEWAARLLRRGRELVLRWTDWAGRQPRVTRLAIGAGALLFLAALAFAAWRIYLAG